jgi:cell division protein ZapA
MKQLEVQIMGQSYLLTAPDGGEQQLLTAVERVDTAMCRIRDAGKVKARDRIAVLAALNLAFDVEASPARPASPAAMPATTPATSLTNDHTSDPRITALVQRLDQALLTGDGQLL